MVEGHQCHRVAHAHRQQLQGRAFKASSPNGRFVEGAAALDGQPLHRIEVHGKYLFYFFGTDPKAPTVLHFHFGMSGAFRSAALPGPPPTPTTRLRLLDEEGSMVSHLSAMTVLHGGLDLYEAKRAKLGPDPLREDADWRLVWDKVSVSSKPIGFLLMDQSVIAGIGNIYRAEILYKAGVHPEQPGRSLSMEVFQRLWRHAVLLLQRGFATGSILTVDAEEAQALGAPWTRRYVYNQGRCGRCGAPVASWSMTGRTVYACLTCQPLLGPRAELSPARQVAMAAASPAQEFRSHCAPDDVSTASPAKLTVAALRAALRALGVDVSGSKAALAARLVQIRGSGEGLPPGKDVGTPEGLGRAVGKVEGSPPFLPQSQDLGEGACELHDVSLVKRLFAGPQAPLMPPEVVPGIAALLGMVKEGRRGGGEASDPDASDLEAGDARPRVASAKRAALEKIDAGEGAGVEHVALQDDASEALRGARPAGVKRRRAPPPRR